MDDKTLLELAAKAAGLKGLHERAGKLCYTTSDGHGGSLMWNPLEDDGDALRLAVKLQISINQNIIRVETGTIDLTLAGIFIHEDTIKQDFGFSTRRAIVRAAAAIGESMQ